MGRLQMPDSKGSGPEAVGSMNDLAFDEDQTPWGPWTWNLGACGHGNLETFTA